MDVKFITTSESNLNVIPVVNGQLIALDDVTGFYYDMNSIRHAVSCIHVVDSLSGIGQEGHIYIVKEGDSTGIYIWDDDKSAYRNFTNEFSEKLLSIVQDTASTKIYPLSTNGEEDSTELYYNTNIYYDLKTGTIVAEEFQGKSTSSYVADEATHAESADEATHAETADSSTSSITSESAKIADKIGEDTIGSSISPVYILEGNPTAIDYTIETSVPEDAVFTDTTYDEYIGATSTENGTAGLVKQPSFQDYDSFLKGDGTWASIIQSEMVGCTSTTNGKIGLVPAPIAGEMNSFLKGDGTWGKYSAGDGLNLSALTFSLSTTGVVAGTYGSIESGEEYSTLTIPQITVDNYGRITSISQIGFESSGTSSSSDINLEWLSILESEETESEETESEETESEETESEETESEETEQE